MLHSSSSDETISHSLEDVSKIPKVTPSLIVPCLEPPRLEATDTDDGFLESGRCYKHLTSHVFFFPFEISSAYFGKKCLRGEVDSMPKRKRWKGLNMP